MARQMSESKYKLPLWMNQNEDVSIVCYLYSVGFGSMYVFSLQLFSSIMQTAMQESVHRWLPLVFVIYLPVSIFITYGISVAKHHVEAWFPYISDTGTYPPESCIFAQLFNIGALIAGYIIYIRYLLISERSSCRKLNLAAFIIGLSSAFGVSVVGNFQETNILVVHLIGAALAFAIGLVYMVLQTVISYKLAEENEIPGNTLCVRRVRVIFCVVDFVLLLLVVSMMIADLNRRQEGESLNRTSDWQVSDEHNVASVSEWLAAFVTVAFFGTFYSEFKHFKIRSPQIIFYDGGRNSILPVS